MRGGGEAAPLLGGDVPAGRPRPARRVGTLLLLTIVGTLAVFQMYTMILPRVIDIGRRDTAWINPIADYQRDRADLLHTPQQVLLTIGENTPTARSVVVSWVTFGAAVKGVPSVVEVQNRTFKGEPKVFVDTMECPTVARLMHAVVVDLMQLDLRGDLSYAVGYQPVSATLRRMGAMRLPHSFFRPISYEGAGKAGRAHAAAAALPTPPPLRAALFGDMGTMSYHVYPDKRDMLASAIPVMTQMTQERELDLIVHIGDIAYNLDIDCGRVGDAFMLDVEPMASQIPYMFGPGNHEEEKWEFGSYAHYLHRYDAQRVAGAASGSHSIRFYSFTEGLVHFVLLDSSAWIHPLTYPRASRQIEWLEEDLGRLDRGATPWVVVMIHRAMYCTKSPDVECNAEALTIRDGSTWGIAPPGLEAILLKHGVDLVISGHTHHYERTYPVARGKATQHDYVNPRGVVHVQSGIAGDVQADRFVVEQAPWEAFRDTSYRRGFLRGTFTNATHASFEQFDEARGVVDAFAIVQEQHGRAM